MRKLFLSVILLITFFSKTAFAQNQSFSKFEFTPKNDANNPWMLDSNLRIKVTSPESFAPGQCSFYIPDKKIALSAGGLQDIYSYFRSVYKEFLITLTPKDVDSSKESIDYSLICTKTNFFGFIEDTSIVKSGKIYIKRAEKSSSLPSDAGQRESQKPVSALDEYQEQRRLRPRKAEKLTTVPESSSSDAGQGGIQIPIDVLEQEDTSSNPEVKTETDKLEQPKFFSREWFRNQTSRLGIGSINPYVRSRGAETNEIISISFSVNNLRESQTASCQLSYRYGNMKVAVMSDTIQTKGDATITLARSNICGGGAREQKLLYQITCEAKSDQDEAVTKVTPISTSLTVSCPQHVSESQNCRCGLGSDNVCIQPVEKNRCSREQSKSGYRAYFTACPNTDTPIDVTEVRYVVDATCQSEQVQCICGASEDGSCIQPTQFSRCSKDRVGKMATFDRCPGSDEPIDVSRVMYSDDSRCVAKPSDPQSCTKNSDCSACGCNLATNKCYVPVAAEKCDEKKKGAMAYFYQCPNNNQIDNSKPISYIAHTKCLVLSPYEDKIWRSDADVIVNSSPLRIQTIYSPNRDSVSITRISDSNSKVSCTIIKGFDPDNILGLGDAGKHTLNTTLATVNIAEACSRLKKPEIKASYRVSCDQKEMDVGELRISCLPYQRNTTPPLRDVSNIQPNCEEVKSCLQNSTIQKITTSCKDASGKISGGTSYRDNPAECSSMVVPPSSNLSPEQPTPTTPLKQCATACLCGCDTTKGECIQSTTAPLDNKCLPDGTKVFKESCPNGASRLENRKAPECPAPTDNQVVRHTNRFLGSIINSVMSLF